MIRGARASRSSKATQTPRDRSYRTLRDEALNAAFPGISCLATIMESLRDKLSVFL
jgi:hypothetical protein